MTGHDMPPDERSSTNIPEDEVVEPDPAEFDPLREVYWTLPMAVAWIRWRTANAVREQWDRWRGQQGWRKASLQCLILAAPEIKSAGLDLLRQLHEGGIIACGFDTRSPGSKSPIPSEGWDGLEDQASGDPDYAPKFRYPCTSPAAGSGYDDVVVRSADVRSLWPTASSQAERPPDERPKRKRGRKPTYLWEQIRPIAERCFANMRDADETALIEAVQHDIKAQKMKVPSRSALQPKLIEWKLY